MNKLTPHERMSMKADLVAAIVAWILVMLIAWWRVETGHLAPILKHNPCAPGYQVFVNGEEVGCTNDAALNQRWRPSLSKD